MTQDQDKLNQLLVRLDDLLQKQESFSREIYDLKEEIYLIKSSSKKNPPKDIVPKRSISNIQSSTSQETSDIEYKKPQKLKVDFEKFIGENLINKIGIIIIIIGVAIGAKYAIENELITPMTRIVLGYLVGVLLLAIAFILKRKFLDFSAVLLSGAMTIMYFITYTAYSFYGLIPQLPSFSIMVVFTIFTVLSAIQYNRQIIAHLGLVGAYAVPFLLSDGSGQVATLFSYMTIINIGILFLSIRKYWKSLFYSSFSLTWLIFGAWYFTRYQSSDLRLAITFLTIFFLIFYITFLAYKLIKKENYNVDDIFLTLSNSFIFYGIGYNILLNHELTRDLVGLYTLINALAHSIAAIIIYFQKLADRNLFYLISGLALIFLTIAVPVQLDGNWVTLLWAGEGALLFWIGRSRNAFFYEKLSYALMIFAFISIIQDWATVYDSYIPTNAETRISLILNIHFLSTLIFIGAFAFINYINYTRKLDRATVDKKDITGFMAIAIPGILLFSAYNIFRMEIAVYWEQLFIDSTIYSTGENGMYHRNYDLQNLKTVWIINYTLLFLSVSSVINNRIVKDNTLGSILQALIVFTLLLFLTEGLYALSELRETYLQKSLSQYYERMFMNILSRYISFAFVIVALVISYQYTRPELVKKDIKKAFDFLLHLTILWIASSELIHWMDITGSSESYKLGLSILYGIYSLFLITLGIWKNKKHLRIGAIVLFGVTLVKLFFYDISHLNTISKTIVFVSLGILLLIISFLYNKYRHKISGVE